MRSIILLLTMFHLQLSAQDFGLVFVNLDSAYAVKTINHSLKTGIKKKTVSSYFQTQSGDTLIISVKDSVDGFTLKLTFNQPDTILQTNTCDFQQYTFDCTPCSQKHLEAYQKSSGYRKLSENKYLSNYWNRNEMEVTYKNQDKACMVITFRTVYMTKEKYKALYRSLSRN